MRYRKIDSSGDMVFGTQNDFYENQEAVGQAIKTALLLFYGEWWEDVDQGLPLFEHILGQSGTTDHVKAVDLLIQSAISNVQGVNAIKDFQSTYDNRTYTITSCTVETIYGDVQITDTTIF